MRDARWEARGSKERANEIGIYIYISREIERQSTYSNRIPTSRTNVGLEQRHRVSPNSSWHLTHRILYILSGALQQAFFRSVPSQKRSAIGCRVSCESADGARDAYWGSATTSLDGWYGYCWWRCVVRYEQDVQKGNHDLLRLTGWYTFVSFKVMKKRDGSWVTSHRFPEDPCSLLISRCPGEASFLWHLDVIPWVVRSFFFAFSQFPKISLEFCSISAIAQFPFPRGDASRLSRICRSS